MDRLIIQQLADHTKKLGQHHEDKGKPLEERCTAGFVSQSDHSSLQQGDRVHTRPEAERWPTLSAVWMQRRQVRGNQE